MSLLNSSFQNYWHSRRTRHSCGIRQTQQAAKRAVKPSAPPHQKSRRESTHRPRQTKKRAHAAAHRTPPSREDSRTPPPKRHRAMARQRQTGSYTWTQVKSVQNLIERCLSQYMTQAEVRGPVSGIGVLRCLHAIDATRFHQTRSWVVSFSILRSFGPRRETRHSTRPHAGHRDAAGPG